MTRTKKRLAVARQLVQLAALTAIGSSMAAGCSSGVKTVTVECTGGASAFAGSAGSNAGEAGSTLGSGGFNNAGEAGQGGASGEENGGSQAGASGSDENAGNAGSSGAGPGGTTGTAGHAGTTSVGTSNGGHGGSAGNNAAAGNAGAAAVAKCGDKTTTPPEFCDDGTNTDLSYGCTACTTLTGTRSPPGAQQCSSCLNDSRSACFACQDYRQCYLCLRQQSSSAIFTNSSNNEFCNTAVDDDDAASPPTTNPPFTPDPTAAVTSRKDFSDRCFDPKSFFGQKTVGGSAGAETFSAECQAVVACVLRTGCMLAGDLYASCYCGLPAGACGADPKRKPFGACADEIREAAGVPPGLDYAGEGQAIGVIVSDPDHAIGNARQIAGCASERGGCHDVCFPNDTGAGTGGAQGSASGAAAGHVGTAGSP